MATNIVPLYTTNNYCNEFARVEQVLRILANGFIGDSGRQAFDESGVYDCLVEAAERLAATAAAVECTGNRGAGLLRIANLLRIVATALFAEVDDNPARDPSVLREALTDIVERVARAAEEYERAEMDARRRA